MQSRIIRTYTLSSFAAHRSPRFRSILICSLTFFFFSSSFFANKGAVAGVFTVVGLIGLVILIALVVNCIRRRQARKFDKELFLATQEAAATAPNPNFLDDEDDEPKRTGYSDVSHGTYGQPPMEAYNMRDMGSHSTAVGEIYDPYANGGAAGIGVVRARSARANPANAALNPYAAALQEGGSPYPQFAMGPRDTYGAAGGPFGRNNMELGAAIIPSGQQQPPYSQRSPPPQEYTTVGRSKSNSTAATHLSTPSQSHTPNYSQSQVQPSYPVRQMSPPRTTPAPGIPPNPYPPHVHASHEMEPSGGSADDAAYGGYVVDDVEEDVPRRVLKVCFTFYFLFFYISPMADICLLYLDCE